MFETLKRLYEETQISGAEIQNAVKRGWITAAQAAEIVGGTR